MSVILNPRKNIFSSYKLSTLTLWLLYGYLAIDSINGVFLRAGSLSISPLYKMAIIFLAAICLRNNKNFLIGLYAVALFSALHLIVQDDPIGALRGLDWILKFFFIFTIYQFFSKKIIEGDVESVFVFAKFSFMILAFNLMAGNFGYGYSQYGEGDEGIGTRGYIHAGNELSGAIVASVSLIFIKLLSEGRNKQFILFGFFSIILTATATTKASLGSLLILFLILPLLKEKTLAERMKTKKIFIVSVVIFFALFFGLAAYYLIYKSNLMDRLTFFYERDGFITLLFSHRNVWASEAISHAESQYSFLQILFGSGQSWWDYISDAKSVEIDPIDAFMTYGLIGLFFVYGFFFSIFLMAKRGKFNNKYSRRLTFCIILIAGISFTAGHIVFSGVAGPLIAALFSLANYKVIK